MTATALLETVISLTVQVSLLLGVTLQLMRFVQAQHTADQLWSLTFRLVLLLTLVAFTLPHPRLWPHEFLRTQLAYDRLVSIESRIGLMVTAIWLGGALVMLLRLVAHGRQAVRVLQASRAVSRQDIASRCPALFRVDRGERVKGLSASLASIRWRATAETAAPFCWQIDRPYVVLPESALVFADDELQAIALHEAAHLAFGHPFSLFLQRLVESLFWFHPLVWWSSREASLAREIVCDRAAAADADEASACLRSLLKLSAERRVDSAPGRGPAGLPFGSNPHTLRVRARHLAAFDRQPAVIRRVPGLLRGSLVGMCLILPTVYIPLDVSASDRSPWSPWPEWSAQSLHAIGIHVRDYELDAHRFHLPHHMGVSGTEEGD